MRFNTHQEIDNHYRALGVDFDKLKREEVAVGIGLANSQKDAKDFLKNNMGKVGFWIWDNILHFPFGVYLSYGFGKDGYIEKAKKLGWENTFQYPKGF